MKRLLWIALSILLLMPCLSYCEEAGETETVDINGKFALTCTVPDGYYYEETQVDEELIIGRLEPMDGLRPTILFGVAESETYAGMTLNDFSEEDLAVEMQLAAEDMADPRVTLGETSHGTKLIIAQDMDPANSCLDITTVYKGYYITFLMYPSIDGTLLTEEQVGMAIDFLSDLWMVEK